MTGMRAAHASGDRELGAHILSYMSIQESWVGNPHDATEIIHSADRGKGASRPIVDVILAIRLALAEAKAGNRYGSERTIEESLRLFQRARADDAPVWTDYFDEALLVSQAGHCLLDLGDPRGAQRYLLRALELRSEAAARDRSIWYSRLGLAHLKDGDLEHAVAMGRNALEMAQRVPSARGFDHVTALIRELRPYQAEPVVKDFRDASRHVLGY